MIDYSEDWLFKLICQQRGSLALRSCTFAIPCALLSFVLLLMDDIVPDLRNDMGLLDLGKSQLWTATTAVLGILLGFRTNRAMARFWEGTGLLHQMRGEWFDSISCCVTFSNGALAAKKMEVKRFRHTIVRLMSLCHGSALEEIAGKDTADVETIDCIGLDNTTLCYLKSCKEDLNFNRVEVLLHLTQSIITKALEDGILKIPPPILSRVYQTLSRGFVNLLNAKKIADTRFPFPYAQLIAMMLFMHAILTPIMISCLIPNKVWGPLFTFVPIFGMFAVNFIGIELENPFGSDENDLPLEHFQCEMNKCLLMLLHEGADIIPTVSENRCIMKYKDLAASMELVDEKSITSSRFSVARFTTASSNEKKLTGVLDSNEVQCMYDDGQYQRWVSESPRSGTSTPSPRCVEPVVKSVEPVAPAPKPEPLALPKEVGNAESKSALLGARELIDKQVLEVGRIVDALNQFSDALHRVVDKMLVEAGNDAGASTIRRMDFEKDNETIAMTLLSQPGDLLDAKAWLAPADHEYPSIQQTRIQPSMISERNGTMLQPAGFQLRDNQLRDKRWKKTPRQDMVLSKRA